MFSLSFNISLSLSCDDANNVTMEIRFSPELLWCRRCHQLWDACGVSHMLLLRVGVSLSRGRADCILAWASMRVVLFGIQSVLIKAVMYKILWWMLFCKRDGNWTLGVRVTIFKAA